MTDHASTIPRERAGTVQPQRGLTALDSAHVSVEERSRSDWLHYLKQLAQWLQYRNSQGDALSWAPALPEPAQIEPLLALLDSGSSDSDAIRQLAARPDIALLLAFIELLRHPQQQFAELTERHLYHYYRNVLALGEQGAEPDQAAITVQLEEDAEPLVLLAGSRFAAGEDSAEQARYYRLEADAGINHARIHSLVSLMLSRGSDSQRYNTGFLRSTLIDTDNGLEFPPATVPTFGDYPANGTLVDPERDQHSPVGIIIASPRLWLSEGQRQIELLFDTDFSTAFLADTVLSGSAGDIRSLLTIAVSSADGMLALDDDSRAEISARLDGDQLVIRLLLSNLFPALAPPPEPHQSQLHSPYLQLNVRADEQGRRILYERLRVLPLSHIELQVQVQGLRSLMLRNDDGLLDASGPVTPFGTQPRVGSQLQLSHPELAIGPLDQLSVQLNWGEDKPASISDHYAAYRDYQYPAGGQPWPQHQARLGSPHGSRSLLPLFQPTLASNAGELAALYPAGLHWPSRDSLPLDSQEPREWPFWYSLTLTGDDFGHSLYPQVVNHFSNQYLQAVNDANAQDYSNSATAQLAAAQAQVRAAEAAAQAAYEEAGAEASAAADAALASAAAALAAAEAAVAAEAATQAVLLAGEKAEEDEGEEGEEGNEDGEATTEETPQDSTTPTASDLLASLLANQNPPPSGTGSPPAGSTAIATPLPVARPVPREVLPPWTPLADSISLDYQAHDSLSVSQAGIGADSQLLHIHPMGCQAIRDAEKQTLLPALDRTAYLYIGLSRPPEGGSVSLLFQHSPVDADSRLRDISVGWSYLADNRWMDFDTNKQSGNVDRAIILADSTNNLVDSGIIRFAISNEMTRNGGFPGDNQLWLRAALDYTVVDSPRWSDLLGLHSQAIRVRYDDREQPPLHLPNALPAGTINELDSQSVNSSIEAAIASVEQPWSSFGGRPPEAPDSFATRASERLRHRNRALTCWDYEHLVLARFPELILANCLRHPGVADDPDQPAHIRLLVVPRSDDPALLKPRVSRDMQQEIYAWLRERMPPRARLVVDSPQFQEVRFKIVLTYKAQYDPGQVLQLINQDLNAHLNPWTDPARSGLRREIHIPDVTAWIRQQPYVEGVIKVTGYLQRFDDQQQPYWHTDNSDTLNADSPEQILVPSSRHTLSAPAQDAEYYEGINTMKIEYDFEVG